jgi:hypothetical protein
MAGLFSSGEQDLLGNIVQQRQQANQALGSGYGKYGGIVQAAAGMADVGADAMTGGMMGSSDPRMQQLQGAKAIFTKVAQETGEVNSSAFYEKLAKALSAQYPEQAQKAADKAMEIKKAEFEMKPKAATPSDLKTLLAERDALPQDDPRRALYDDKIKLLTKGKPAAEQASPQIVQLQKARDAIKAINPNDPRIQEIQKQIDKLGEASKGTEIKLELPGAEKPIDITKFRNDVIASVKPYTNVIDIADTVILGIDLGLTEGNFAAVEGASKALVKAFGDGQISRLEAINAGADPSLIGGGIDYMNKLFTGTPSTDTMKKIKKTAEALKILNAKKQKAELKSQKDIARRSGYTEADIKLLFSSFEDSKQRKVVNTGVEKSTGRKVIKYDDGSVEYAD